MANPSLQIGNSNWAIKEDDLLGYSTVGTNYLPKPMTMTRASAGTRVNAEGLVNYAEIIGSEEITNGSFNTTIPIGTNGSGWTKVIAGSCTIEYDNGGIKLTQASVGNQDCKIYARTVGGSSNLLTVGRLYKVTYEVLSNNNSTDLKYYRGGSYLQIDHTVGTHTFYYEQESNQLSVFWNLTANSDITLDNVSIKEVTRNNLARVDYTDGTGSLLVEPQRKNEVTYSEDLTQWTGLIALSIGLNQGTSPSGLTDANLLSIGIDASATRHRLYNLFSFVSGDTYTFSMFAKKNEQDWFQLMFSSTAFDAQSYANFDLNNGVVGNTGTSTTANIIYYGSGWYRCSITCTATASITTTYEVLTTNNTDSGRYPSYQSDSNVDVCYLWGAQLEEGSYATSYIPNFGTSAGVTRVQDQYSKTGISNLINSTEGVLFAEIAALSDDGTFRSISLSNGTATNRVSIRYNTTSNAISAYLYQGSAPILAYNNVVADVKDFHKVAIKYKSGDVAFWVDGVEVATSTSTFTFLPLTDLSFVRGDSVRFFYGKVKQLQIFKTALTDEQLTALTT